MFINLKNNLKFLRNTPLNIFAYSVERKKEKQLINTLNQCIKLILKNLNNNNYKNSLELIEIFSEIKGFGHVKLKNFNNFENQYEQKIKEFKQSSKKIDLAAE